MSDDWSKEGSAPARPGKYYRAAGDVVGEAVRGGARAVDVDYASDVARELVEGPTWRRGFLRRHPSGIPAPVIGLAQEAAIRSAEGTAHLGQRAGGLGAQALDVALRPGEGYVADRFNRHILDRLLTPMGLGTSAVLASFPISADIAYQRGTTLAPLGEAQGRGETLMTDPFQTFVQERERPPRQKRAANIGTSVIDDLIKKLISKPDSATAIGKSLQNLSIPRAAGLAGAGVAVGAGLDLLHGDTSVGTGLEYMAAKKVIPIEDRIQATDTASKAFLTQAGKNMANIVDDSLRQGINLGAGAAMHHNRSFNQDLQFQQAITQDPLLNSASPEDKEMLRRSFNTMTRFSPDLATDEFAVRNFLRESLMAANGPDYATLGQMARVNEAISPAAPLPMKPRDAI